MDPMPAADAEIKAGNTVTVDIQQGDKLFNSNTPFIVNISSKDTESKKSNVDLICIIDNSGSMDGTKINLVKQSLKVLVSLMDSKDRIALVLFNSSSSILLDLTYVTSDSQKLITSKINSIEANGGTNILSGLQKGVDIMKKEKGNNKENSNRVTGMILLSDGCDNNLDDVEIADGLKQYTKKDNLLFTLHCFGYGEDHDPKIMNRLCNMRDGSFYFVEEYEKVQEYFVNVLGGCMSVISKKADLKVRLTNSDSKIVKIFGLDNLYSHEESPTIFETTLLQMISGKEYTFVMEINVPGNVAEDSPFLKANFSFNDLTQDNKNIIVEATYNYKKKNTDEAKLAKANDEYVRCKVFDSIGMAMELKQERKNSEARKILTDVIDFLNKKYKGDTKDYLEELNKVLNLVKNDYEFATRGVSYITSTCQERMTKKGGSRCTYSNSIQMNMIERSRKSAPMYIAEPIEEEDRFKKVNSQTAPMRNKPKSRFGPDKRSRTGDQEDDDPDKKEDGKDKDCNIM